MKIFASLPDRVLEFESEKLATLCPPGEALAQLAEIGSLHARMLVEARRLKVKLKRRYAIIEAGVRQQASAAKAGGFRMTEAMIEAEVSTNAQYIALEDVYLDALSEMELLGAMREVLRLKVQVLLSSSGEATLSAEDAHDDPGADSDLS